MPRPRPIGGPPTICEALEPRRLLSASVPRFDHVVIVVEENKDYQDILGRGTPPPVLWPVVPPTVLTQAPFLRQLARQGASLTTALGETHPSQPNYLALFSGSTQGVTSDATPTAQFSAPTLGGQLRTAGLTFAGYSEDLPHEGYTGAKSGDYARKHAPWVDFSDVPASANKPFRALPKDEFSALPTVSFVIPNQQHDMHSGSIGQGDRWLRQELGGYASWARTHNSLLIVTWDEGRTDNHIPTIFYGAHVRKGDFAYETNHYRVLRTIEAMYGLTPLGHAAENAPLRKIFGGAAATTGTATRVTTTPKARFSETPVTISAWAKLEEGVVMGPAVKPG